MADRDILTTAEIVKLARRLERLMAQRRRAIKKLERLEHDIRTARRLLHGLSLERAGDIGELPTDGAR